jgi:hypothetical protein
VKTLITGSFDFIKAAEGSNAKNLVIIDGKQLAGKYVESGKLHTKPSIVSSLSVFRLFAELPKYRATSQEI